MNEIIKMYSEQNEMKQFNVYLLIYMNINTIFVAM